MEQKTRIQKSIESPVRSSDSDELCRGLNISRNKLTEKLVSPFRDWIFIENIITENKEVPSGTK